MYFNFVLNLCHFIASATRQDVAYCVIYIPGLMKQTVSNNYEKTQSRREYKLDVYVFLLLST